MHGIPSRNVRLFENLSGPITAITAYRNKVHVCVLRILRHPVELIESVGASGTAGGPEVSRHFAKRGIQSVTAMVTPSAFYGRRENIGENDARNG